MTATATGARFGPYEIERALGVGGMAETWVAIRRGPGHFEQRVCLKRIHPHLEKDPRFVEQFVQEARVSAQLRHANIVQVLDFGVTDGSHYLALELVDGLDLYRLLDALGERGQALTSGLVVFLANELATALDVAHNASGGPVLHRDVSPSNVLLSTAGEVKLSDFGIAKAADQRGPQTTSGAVKGKAPYMAAEYALSGKFEPASDLFALGVLLYESLAGRRPFDGATDLDTLHRIMRGEHTPLAELCPSAPPRLVETIEQLIVPDPKKRIARAAEVIDALVELPPPPTSRRILGELVRRTSGQLATGERPVAPIEGAVPTSSRIDRPAAPSTPQTPPVVALPPTKTRTPTPGDDSRPGERVGDAVPVALPTPSALLPVREERRRSWAWLLLALLLLTCVGGGAGLVTSGVLDTGAAPELAAAEPPALTAPTETATPIVVASAGTPELARDPIVPAIEPTAIEPTAIEPAAIEPTAVEPTEAPVATTTIPPPRPPRPPRPDPAGTTGVTTPVPPPVTSTTGTGATTTQPDPPPEPEPVPVPATEPPPERREPARGRLIVTVAPWGDVWVDDRPMGRAPIDIPLSAGAHRVEVGMQRPMRSRQVVIHPNDTSRMDIELDSMGP